MLFLKLLEKTKQNRGVLCVKAMALHFLNQACLLFNMALTKAHVALGLRQALLQLTASHG